MELQLGCLQGLIGSRFDRVEVDFSGLYTSLERPRLCYCNESPRDAISRRLLGLCTLALSPHEVTVNSEIFTGRHAVLGAFT